MGTSVRGDVRLAPESSGHMFIESTGGRPCEGGREEGAWTERAEEVWVEGPHRRRRRVVGRVHPREGGEGGEPVAQVHQPVHGGAAHGGG